MNENIIENDTIPCLNPEVLYETAVVHNANIGYNYYCSVFKDQHSLPENEKIKILKDAATRVFSSYCFSDSPESKDNPLFGELNMVQEFLHGDGLPFECSRILTGDFNLSHDSVNITTNAVMITYYYEVDILQFTLYISVKDCSVATLVYMRQLHCGNPVFSNGSDRVSVEGIFRGVVNDLGLEPHDIDPAYIIEIKDFLDFDSAVEIGSSKPKMIYGLLSGDEGWQYVPDDLARQRTEFSWGSREFMRLYTFGPNFVFFNLDESQCAREYRGWQKSYGTAYYGGINPYFLVSSSLAGLTHGILFAMDLVMVTKTICDRILQRQAEFQKSGSQDFSRDIKKTKNYRRELITTLSKVESISISELGELETVMLTSQKIAPIIDKTKYLLELLESELDLMYQYSTNRLVNIITGAGVCLAFLQVLLAIF